LTNASISSKEDLVFLVKLCEKASRFDDMFVFMSQYVELGNQVSDRERHLFALALRKSIADRRNAWRRLKSDPSSGVYLPLGFDIATFQDAVGDQIRTRTSTALEHIKKHILPICTSPDQRVYFLMLKGDMERYNAEISSGSNRESWVKQSHSSYKEAGDVAVGRLKPTDPIRLSLMLNLSIFYYEIYNSAERACVVAKAACDDAFDTGLFSKRLKSENEGLQRESAEIYETIRNNLKKWTAHLVPKVSKTE
jgi:14-3-3 protein epsilon